MNGGINEDCTATRVSQLVSVTDELEGQGLEIG